MSRDSQDLIIRMLEKNEEKRISSQEILYNSWIQLADEMQQDCPSLEKNIRQLVNIKYKIRFEEAVILFLYESVRCAKEIDFIRSAAKKLNQVAESQISVADLQHILEKIKMKVDVEKEIDFI